MLAGGTTNLLFSSGWSTVACGILLGPALVFDAEAALNVGNREELLTRRQMQCRRVIKHWVRVEYLPAKGAHAGGVYGVTCVPVHFHDDITVLSRGPKATSIVACRASSCSLLAKLFTKRSIIVLSLVA